MNVAVTYQNAPKYFCLRFSISEASGYSSRNLSISSFQDFIVRIHVLGSGILSGFWVSASSIPVDDAGDHITIDKKVHNFQVAMGEASREMSLFVLPNQVVDFLYPSWRVIDPAPEK